MLQLELQLDALTLVFCLLRGPLTARQRVFPEHVPEYLLEACAFVRDLGQSRLSVIQVSFNLAGPPAPARLTPAAPLGVRARTPWLARTPPAPRLRNIVHRY